VRFLGWGRSNADIATLLLISDNTVRVHLSNVARKLELDGMRELAALAGLRAELDRRLADLPGGG
jgi:DNA-binding NarL/FixJ family response regulator